MARPREFDREEALERAMHVFWEKGYAATSTDALLAAMNIGRQSLYNAFGDKRKLYVEALERYQAKSIGRHLKNLDTPVSPIAGLESLLLGLIPRDDASDPSGCMGVNAVCEFGADDADLCALRDRAAPALQKRLLARIREGQSAGELDIDMDAREAATFVMMTMQGIQLGNRAGMESKALRAMARFAVDRLRA